MKKVVNLCAVVVAFGALSGCITSKQSYVSKGNKLYDAGKYDDAALNYRKAIQKDPNYGEAYYRFGLSAIKQDHPLEAYDSLYRAAQLLPDRTDVIEKFADVSLSFYLADPSHPKARYQQLVQLSDQLLSKNPNSYEGLMVKGYLFSTDRKVKEGIQFFRKALQVDSADPGVKTSLVQDLIVDGQLKEAESLAMELINVQKTSYGRIYDLMYAQYFSSNRVNDAENILKARVQNNPKQADGIVQLALHYNRVKKPDEMKATLQRLVDNPKDFPAGSARVGDFYMGLRDYPTAIHYYEEGLRAHPDGKEKVFYQNKKLVALLAQGKTDEAASLNDRILAENPKDDDALRVRANLWLDSKKPEHLDAALRIFQDLSTRKPTDARLRFHLGRAYRRKGDLESALKEFQQAIRIEPAFIEAKYELGLIDLMRRQSGDALQQANEILAIRPDYRPAKLLRTESLIRTGDANTARKELAALAKDSPNDNQVQFQLALIALSEKKFPQALETLNALRSTGDPQVFVGLGNIYTGLRNFDKAFEALNDGLKKSGDSILIHNQIAITAVIAKQYDRALAEFEKVLSMDPKSVETMRLIADVYELKGSPDEAIKMYRKAFETVPTNVPSALALAGALSQAGRMPEARTLYLGIAKAHPEDPVVLNNAAFLLAEMGGSGNLDEALRMAKSALQKSPKDASYSDTIGYVYLKQGNRDSAIQIFNSLVRRYPRYPVFRYHLGLTLYEKGDKAGARRELQTALNDHPARQDEQRIKELLKKLG